MQQERTPQNRLQEQRHYVGYAQDLRERLHSGLLSELIAYPQFVVWKYNPEQGKLKKRPFNPRTHLPIASRFVRKYVIRTKIIQKAAVVQNQSRNLTHFLDRK